MKALALATSLSIVSVSPALACDPSDWPLHQAFEGEWQSSGNAFGQPASSHMRWTPVMDGCFWQIEYSIETNPGTDDADTFRGRGVHIAANGVIEGSWIDNMAVIHRLRGTINEIELMVYWGEPDETLGRSRYTALENGGIQVTDWILTDDGWQTFNDNRFERVGP